MYTGYHRRSLKLRWSTTCIAYFLPLCTAMYSFKVLDVSLTFFSSFFRSSFSFFMSLSFTSDVPGFELAAWYFEELDDFSGCIIDTEELETKLLSDDMDEIESDFESLEYCRFIGLNFLNALTKLDMSCSDTFLYVVCLRSAIAIVFPSLVVSASEIFR